MMLCLNAGREAHPIDDLVTSQGVCKLRSAKVRKCEVVNCEVECEVGCDWLVTRASPRSLPVAMCKLRDPKLRKCYVVNCEVKCEVGCDWLAIPDNQ